jgi:hypothetical protein
MRYFQILLIAGLLLPLAASSQCRSFTKKKCMPSLAGYEQNDSFNSAVLIPGDEAELLLTFYEGKDYRLVVCAHPILGKVSWELLDTSEKLIFANTNEDGSIKSDFFDFKVSNTQQLMLRVKVPKSDSVLVHEGCVSIMSGTKDI